MNPAVFRVPPLTVKLTFDTAEVYKSLSSVKVKNMGTSKNFHNVVFSGARGHCYHLTLVVCAFLIPVSVYMFVIGVFSFSCSQFSRDIA